MGKPHPMPALATAFCEALKAIAANRSIGLMAGVKCRHFRGLVLGMLPKRRRSDGDAGAPLHGKWKTTALPPSQRCALPTRSQLQGRPWLKSLLNSEGLERSKSAAAVECFASSRSRETF
jgi:hypothetical protein